jgi:hypothetical protein
LKPDTGKKKENLGMIPRRIAEQGRTSYPSLAQHGRHHHVKNPGHYNARRTASSRGFPGVPDETQAGAYPETNFPFNPSAPPLSPRDEKERTERALENYERLFHVAHRVKRRRRLAGVLLNWQKEFADLKWKRWTDGPVIHYEENTYNYYCEEQPEPENKIKKYQDFFERIWAFIELIQHLIDFFWVTKHFWAYGVSAALIAKEVGLCEKITLIYGVSKTEKVPESPGPAPEFDLLE